MQIRAIFLPLFLVSFLAISGGLAFQDCTCGSDCFQTNDTNLMGAYREVERAIKGIRVGNFLASPQPDSTIIHFDGTPTSFNGFLYQRQLAAIAALQIPVDQSCNPALVITYFHWGSLAMLPSFSTGCMDKCGTATYINDFIPFIPTPAISTNPLSTSCLLAPLVASLYPTCSINTGFGSHQIAFMNDDIQTPPFPCFSSNTRTAVKMAPLTSPVPEFESSPMNSIEAFITPDRVEASEKILKCIEAKCCGDQWNRANSLENEATLFIQKNNDLRAQKVDLSRNRKARSMSMKNVIKGVALKEEMNFLAEEHPKMLKSTMESWKGMEEKSSSFRQAMELAESIDEKSELKPQAPIFSPRSE